MFLPLIWSSGITFWLARDLSVKNGKNYMNDSVLPLSNSPLPLLFLSAKAQRSRFTESKVTGHDTRPFLCVCVCVCVCVCALLSEYVCVIMLAGFVGAVRAQHIVQQAAILQNTGEEMTQGGGSFLSTGVCSLHECANRELTVKGVRLCHAASVNKRSRGPHKHRDKQSKLSFNSWLNPLIPNNVMLGAFR